MNAYFVSTVIKRTEKRLVGKYYARRADNA